MPQNLSELVTALSGTNGSKTVSSDRLWHSIHNALDPKNLITNLAEALRITELETEALLIQHGFGDIVSRKNLETIPIATSKSTLIQHKISSQSATSSFPSLFTIKFVPPLNEPISLHPTQSRAVKTIAQTIGDSTSTDAFLALYRRDILDYHQNFLQNDAKAIDEFVHTNFSTPPKYLLNSGIGGNEMSNHMIAQLNNLDPNKKLDWIVISAPKQLSELPKDATVKNTLFIEFSRSGKTEETVKLHEFTPRQLKRIVYANSGPLYELGKRDNNLVLHFPDEVSGRYGRNKTPTLLAPMHIAGFDTSKYWQFINKVVTAFNFDLKSSLPLQLAQYIYTHQLEKKINQIFFATISEPLLSSADELMQFWDEGVNKGGNDLMLCRYLGLPRDSHTILEGILGNHSNKMALILLRDDLNRLPLPTLAQKQIDAINPAHSHLNFGEDELILAKANQARLEEVMPTVTLTTHGSLSYEHALALGQLWADTTFCYSKLIGVDPGSNPEVKHVRDRASTMLIKPYETDSF